MKNLVIVMAGNGSLHEHYAENRDFELWVCYWGDDTDVAARFRKSCDRMFRLKGQKWELAREIGRLANEGGQSVFSGYDFVFLPDDDIEFPGAAAQISASFQLAKAIGADAFQPAIANENVSPFWDVTRVVDGAVCHAASMVEIMMPCYSGEVFEKCVLPLLHINGHLVVGWGIEPLISRSIEAHYQRPPRNFVLDVIAVNHTRAVGNGSSAYSIGRDEVFITPVFAGIRRKEIARFDSREHASAFAFPATDDLVNWNAVTNHMKRIRRARHLLLVWQHKGWWSFIFRRVNKYASRRVHG